MLDIRFVRENPEAVKENIRKKFQDAKLPLVDEVIALDAQYRAAIGEASDLRANRNKLSKQIGMLMGQAKKDPSKAAEAEEVKKQVTAQADRLKELEAQETELQARIQEIMYTIPQMIDPSVPIGPDDSHNVEVQRFGEAKTPDFPIPYHVEIMESFEGIDLDAAGRVAGNGFYYLLGDIARLHEAVLAYARDFMIDKGFTYVIPPFMMHGDVVKGVMSFPEMDAMMYKIEGEDLYLIGTSEHTMIGRFIDQMLDGSKLPITLTSYSPCFRKEKGAHGIEERGIYRIHQFEKQEMIVVCKPEDSMNWYEKLWRNSVELFQNLEIPVRQLECCSGDLADLKVKSCDIEAWSPRQQKYFEVCSCSNLGDAQARRLHIRYKDENGKPQLAHTLNNTCVAPPRMLIAFLENHLQADGTVTIPPRPRGAARCGHRNPLNRPVRHRRAGLFPLLQRVEFLDTLTHGQMTMRFLYSFGGGVVSVFRDEVLPEEVIDFPAVAVGGLAQQEIPLVPAFVQLGAFGFLGLGVSPGNIYFLHRPPGQVAVRHFLGDGIQIPLFGALHLLKAQNVHLVQGVGLVARALLHVFHIVFRCDAAGLGVPCQGQGAFQVAQQFAAVMVVDQLVDLVVQVAFQDQFAAILGFHRAGHGAHFRKLLHITGVQVLGGGGFRGRGLGSGFFRGGGFRSRGGGRGGLGRGGLRRGGCAGRQSQRSGRQHTDHGFFHCDTPPWVWAQYSIPDLPGQCLKKLKTQKAGIFQDFLQKLLDRKPRNSYNNRALFDRRIDVAV